MKVYLLWDCNDGEVLSVHKTMEGARQALADFVFTLDLGYLNELANIVNVNTLDQLKQALINSPEYDDEVQMWIVEYILKD